MKTLKTIRWLAGVRQSASKGGTPAGASRWYLVMSWERDRVAVDALLVTHVYEHVSPRNDN